MTIFNILGKVNNPGVVYNRKVLKIFSNIPCCIIVHRNTFASFTRMRCSRSQLRIRISCFLTLFGGDFVSTMYSSHWSMTIIELSEYFCKYAVQPAKTLWLSSMFPRYCIWGISNIRQWRHLKGLSHEKYLSFPISHTHLDPLAKSAPIWPNW